MQKFELKRIVASIAPACGEDLGAALAKAAGEMRMSSAQAQMLYLAAEALEAGAAASIGHNRADRYEARARELRRDAKGIEAALENERVERESASLLVAFNDGYASRDISRYSFEARKAALIGQLFAKEGRDPPLRINMIYAPRPLGPDNGRDHMLVDHERFVIDYPDGKVADAIVTRI